MTTQTGFKQDHLGSYIDKDPGATLVYSIDWSDWLPGNDTISTVSFAIASPTPTDANDMDIVSSGIITGNITYAEISGGLTSNVYPVATTITTADGLTDVRRFRIKVQNRYL